MALMWASFVLLTLVALLFVVVPFFKRERIQRLDHNANSELIRIYHQRLDELKTDLDNQRIDAQMHDESVIEQKRRLLNELSPEKALNSKGNNRIFALTGAGFLIVLTAIFYGYTGSQQQIKGWHDAMANLKSYGERAVMQDGEPLTPNELQAFALALRTKLDQSGDDEVAWMLLGRVAMSLNEFDMAMQSFDKVLKMNPDNKQVLISYSQVLLMEGSDANMSRAATMLSRVLKAEPTNIDAISLLALIAYERKDWLQAKTAFEVLLASMQQNDPRYSMIAERIAEIDAHLNNQQQVTNTEIAEASHSEIRITVDLDSALADSQPQNGTLFVFAKAASGPQMPLAVVKMTEYSFPLTVTLSDSNAMVEGLNLSSVDKIILTARLSKDATVVTSSGELEGKSGILERANVKEYALLINELIP
ncbi:c-type cytochrome biogenesis protein CcmI [Pseudoalteromonas sp. ACER1]|jgi:cytochrome c-type biogenesis protein CcmI|uniref:Cytochrome C biogenesis protein n=1 Tax=Pseudoalteromonas lipolytica TaxID=570156 RepID=A0A0P7D4I5_9GAMM|nr:MULTISPECIES: c-type cytochrome biogenesis protein CcmI [Pseudoalteromonas]MEC8139261.1 c-type cytochrome biogenesis protein CcmI [Pseudomonadota bacterium]KPM83340.1 cytochrome C biogenesis protein [Pseudoalteromonas lipolytica]MBC7008796.1 c-type cytochrome biogenesis protein CcmI [Pseudoalteromonas sp. BZK2]MCF2847115.1 c-type cytochrome biogenesis protein CcmI [Pseudoalteromonas sp. PAST1]MCO7210939.1 c-type cytochrome biogenesis protein CcmI [Pseudoalteromonas sp. ACER1]